LNKDSEPDPKFPLAPIKIRLAATRLLLVFLLLIVGCAYTLAVAIGYLPSPSPIPEVLFWLLALFLTCGVIGYAYLMLPPLIAGYELKISRDGIVVRSYAAELIPWSAIVSIEIVEMPLLRSRRTVERIDLISDRELPLKLQRRLNRKKWRNFRKDAIATIIPENLNYTTTPGLYAVLCDYHSEFGGRKLASD